LIANKTYLFSHTVKKRINPDMLRAAAKNVPSSTEAADQRGGIVAPDATPALWGDLTTCSPTTRKTETCSPSGPRINAWTWTTCRRVFQGEEIAATKWP
jgi:hypothetical protein